MKKLKCWLAVTILVLLIYGTGGCRGEAPAEEGETEMTIQLTSSAFTEGDLIPKRHTCDGEDFSPALAWTGVPQGTKSLALIMDDPDAPVGTFVHWVLYDMPGDLTSLSEWIARKASLSGVGTQGKNGFGETGYNGPCPPRGKAHRYYFKLYALDTILGLKPGASKADVEKAMVGHILAQGQLMGKYGR